MVALLENFENAKINRKYTFPAISEDLSFKISQGSMHPDPLADLHYFTPRLCARSNFQKPCQGAPTPMYPHFYNASYVPRSEILRYFTNGSSLQLHVVLETFLKNTHWKACMNQFSNIFTYKSLASFRKQRCWKIGSSLFISLSDGTKEIYNPPARELSRKEDTQYVATPEKYPWA